MTTPTTVTPEKNEVGENTRSTSVDLRGGIAVLDSATPLSTMESINLPSEARGNSEEVAAKVSLPFYEDGDLSFAIIKSSSPEGTIRYFMQGLTPDPKTGEDVVPPYLTKRRTEITSDGVVLGKAADKNGDRLAQSSARGVEVPAAAIWGSDVRYTDMISAAHLDMRIVNGELVIADTSTNGTKIEASKFDTQLQDELAFGPAKAVERSYVDLGSEKRFKIAEQLGLIDEKGDFMGHSVIEGALPVKIDGMVDLANFGQGTGEAVVIDSDTEAGLPSYVRLMTALNEEAAKPDSATDTPIGIARCINAVVTRTLTYDLSVESGDKPMADAGRRVGLSEYLTDGRGFCVQMALTSAWLATKVAEVGHLDGWSFSIERNKAKSTKENTAHEYFRMDHSNGDAIIIDPAANIVETLFDLVRKEADTGQQNVWGYVREGETSNYAQRISEQRAAENSAVTVDGVITGVPDWIKRGQKG